MKCNHWTVIISVQGVSGKQIKSCVHVAGFFVCLFFVLFLILYDLSYGYNQQGLGIINGYNISDKVNFSTQVGCQEVYDVLYPVSDPESLAAYFFASLLVIHLQCNSSTKGMH